MPKILHVLCLELRARSGRRTANEMARAFVLPGAASDSWGALEEEELGAVKAKVRCVFPAPITPAR